MSGPWEYQELLPREPIHVIIEPIRRFEMGLHPWVAFVIMPTFALANAGVRIEGTAVLGMAAPGCR